MYQNIATATATGAMAAGSLPFTGLNIVWVLLAAFTLLAASGALWRIVPRREA